MQIEKLLEEQEKEFDKKFVGEYDTIIDGINEPYITGISDKTLYSVDGLMDKAFDWHKQSLKQFIDGLVEREEKNIEKVRRELHDGMLFDESNWIDAKEETTAHLKEIRKQLE